MRNVQLDHAAHKASSYNYPVCYLAHDINVATNVGSFFRMADALGVERVFLTGKTVAPPNPKLRKTSRCTENYVDFTLEDDPIPVIDRLKATGYRIISLETTNRSIDLALLEVSVDDKFCLLLGSENHGVHEDLLARSDEVVHIPMLGENSSMNVASACAITTYDIIRRLNHQRLPTPHIDHGTHHDAGGATPDPDSGHFAEKYPTKTCSKHHL